MISSWLFDVFIIWVAIFIIPPTSALFLPLCVPHPSVNCVNITHFRLIYQGVLQRIFGMLSVKNGSFLTMLRCSGISGQHVLVYVISFSISFYFYNFEYTPHSISDATWFFGDACVGPPGGIQPERVRRWRALSYWFLSIYIRGISAAYWLYLFQAW